MASQFLSALIDDGKGPHRKGAKSLDLDRHGKETQPGVRQLLQAAHVLADGNVGSQQEGMGRPVAVGGVIDVVGVDADQGRARLGQKLGGGAGQKGMAFEIGIGAPVASPAGVYQHRFAPQSQPFEGGVVDGSGIAARGPDHHRLQVSQGGERQFRQILPVGKAVEGAVDIGAGVGHHFDLADVELGPLSVMVAGFLPAQKIADDGGGQPFVGNQPRFHGVAEVDQIAGHNIPFSLSTVVDVRPF